ncbi:nicotinate-nucleotide adenylyltransferase [Gordonia oryzae]|uniref:Probable nicotinate-nucleotide adenylyltransferase n=1 Tax=Gordonia oryzae TaxID=2487349 RepID=A0A3N4H9X2_9ACTN|nr:nicotinate-nucleotide adenylyltransferase [Gordonia oryzae]RPA62204.1 nicotinate-nucleotide adenylyltransferase [Gordonia oryzae]
MSTDRPQARRRIGVMGGTFDPIHNGHLVAASEVAHRFSLHEVIFVPTGRPWQKLGEDEGSGPEDVDQPRSVGQRDSVDPRSEDDQRSKEVSPAEDRYLMTVIATASNPRFSVSRVDIDREGNTYTVDTLRDLNATLPDAELFFITGADALESILSWQNWEELFELANFIGVSRPGYELNASHLSQHLQDLPPETLQMLEIPALAISSTECRARAAHGRPVWYLVPDGVVQYIAKRRLYRPLRSNSARVSAP